MNVEKYASRILSTLCRCCHLKQGIELYFARHCFSLQDAGGVTDIYIFNVTTV